MLPRYPQHGIRPNSHRRVRGQGSQVRNDDVVAVALHFVGESIINLALVAAVVD